MFLLSASWPIRSKQNLRHHPFVPSRLLHIAATDRPASVLDLEASRHFLRVDQLFYTLPGYRSSRLYTPEFLARRSISRPFLHQYETNRTIPDYPRCSLINWPFLALRNSPTRRKLDILPLLSTVRQLNQQVAATRPRLQPVGRSPLPRNADSHPDRPCGCPFPPHAANLRPSGPLKIVPAPTATLSALPPSPLAT